MTHLHIYSTACIYDVYDVGHTGLSANISWYLCVILAGAGSRQSGADSAQYAVWRGTPFAVADQAANASAGHEPSSRELQHLANTLDGICEAPANPQVSVHEVLI
jgi:hypothetical protein